MKLTNVPVHPRLTGYVERIWVSENNGRAPVEDMKLIVPNGFIKMVIPFRNRLSGKMNGWYHLSEENQMTLIGICDLPSVVDVEKDAPCGTIGVEFSPKGAYRFFRLPQHEIKNQIHPLTDILGNTAKRIESAISGSNDVIQKLDLVQQFLLQLFDLTHDDSVFAYCISKIRSTNGSVTVRQLEKETGYSSRWLNMKFKERIGISPKNLSSIIRFQFYYQALTLGGKELFRQRDYYDLYFDQAHFIKEFKRFTGLPPVKFEKNINEFGRLFYKKS